MGFLFGGQARIRTLEGVCQQIYSLPRLTASVPTHKPRDSVRNFTGVEPLSGIEPETFSLPWRCSTS